MEDKKKDDTLASIAKGTTLSTTTNNTTNSLTYQGNDCSKMQHAAVLETIGEATRGGTVDIHATALQDLSEAVLHRTLLYVSNANDFRDKGEKIRLPNSISAEQAGMLVFAYERIRMVCSDKSINDEKTQGVVTVYASDGENEGIYVEIGDGQIETWCNEVAGAVSPSWKNGFLKKLHDMAAISAYRVTENADANLVFMKNCVLDYETKLRFDFDLEWVSLLKSSTVLPEVEPPVPVRTKPDGTTIDFWQLLYSYVPYKGGPELLIKVAGAALRAGVNWRTLVTFYNKTRHNGKSTFLDHLKALVGSQACMTSNLKTLAGARFGVASIVGKTLITCEDSSTGAYIKKIDRLKNIISNDDIEVERKNENSFTYKPKALVVAAANDIATTKEKSEA